MMNIQNQFGRGLRPLLRTPLFVAALALPLVGCEDILDVEDPDVARPESVQSETALPAVLAAMVGDFQVAYGGSPAPGFAGSTQEGQILISGLLADEYIASGSFPTRVEVDQRLIDVDNATMQGAFRSLHRARITAERSTAAHAQFSPNTAGHAQSLSFAGYTYIFFGENYCAGVPFSQQAANGAFEFGAGLSTEQMFQEALKRFDAALAAANAAQGAATNAAGRGAAAAQQNLARIGRGRALLNLGRFPEAAAAVREVPTGFVFVIQHSENSTRQNNGVFNLVNIAKRWSVADREGGNGLPYRSANDPRVTSARTGFGFDQTTPHFSQLKYANRSADIPLATGTEARLIEAEVAARSNNTAASLQILNALRAGVTGLPALTSGSIDDVFRERAFWMWQTSHRLGDMRRLIRQYGRNREQVFPTGQYFKGGTYGPDVNFPVSVDEENNPNFETCTNRNA